MLLVAGFAIAPSLIATTAMIEQVTPAARLTEGMALLHTGLVAGVAPGAAVAGLVVDARRRVAGLLVPLGGRGAGGRGCPRAPRRAADMELGAAASAPSVEACQCSPPTARSCRRPARRVLRERARGRLPISMVSLGIVLLIPARTDSYGVAGAISAAYIVATAVSALSRAG